MSLVIPSYNEAKNLPSLIQRIVAVFTSVELEAIIVDNGSTDSTQDVLRQLSQDHAGSKGGCVWRSVRVPINKGYGHGIVAGLSQARGDIIGWTHADLQTDPADALKCLEVFESSTAPDRLFVKGRRYGRAPLDTAFTAGMSAFESILFRMPLNDINAQPTMFHRSFLEQLSAPPDDFSLDLFAYVTAVSEGLSVRRVPVHFGRRLYGNSHWNFGLGARMRFIRRTMSYSFALKRRLQREQAT